MNTIAAAWSKMLRLFRSRAGLFVTIGWLLFVVSIPICLTIGAAATINAFYFPTNRMAPFDVFTVRASSFVLAAGALAAVASSIALAAKRRAVASVLVVAIWSVISFGTPGARLLVKPGPEHLERHLGQQVFLVPWQYAPTGSAEEGLYQVGLSVRFCLSDLKGPHDKGCHDGRGLTVAPKEQRATDFDIKFWRGQSSQMTPEPERSGYQSYAYRRTMPTGGPARITHYFVRKDSEGQVMRLVVCRLDGEAFCSHHALVGDYWFKYDAPLTDGDALDGKLAALVESWRRK